jgi:hypothetical protein
MLAWRSGVPPMLAPLQTAIDVDEDQLVGDTLLEERRGGGHADLAGADDANGVAVQHIDVAVCFEVGFEEVGRGVHGRGAPRRGVPTGSAGATDAGAASFTWRRPGP